MNYQLSDMLENIPILVALFGLLGTLGTAFVMIRKNNAEAGKTSAEAADLLTSSALSAAQKMIDEFQEYLRNSQDEIRQLKARMVEMEQFNKQLEEEINAQYRQYEQTIGLQNSRISVLEAEVIQLKMENARLRARNSDLENRMDGEG